MPSTLLPMPPDLVQEAQRQTELEQSAQETQREQSEALARTRADGERRRSELETALAEARRQIAELESERDAWRRDCEVAVAQQDRTERRLDEALRLALARVEHRAMKVEAQLYEIEDRLDEAPAGGGNGAAGPDDAS